LRKPRAFPDLSPSLSRSRYTVYLGEVSRFPALVEIFWHAGAGSLDVANARHAAEQFVGLLRGKTQLVTSEAEPSRPTAAAHDARGPSTLTRLRHWFGAVG